MKPHIGLNADYIAEGKRYHKLYVEYTQVVVDTGGVPVIIPAMREDEDILSVLATIDALVLTGGDDLDPELYGEKPHQTVSRAASERQHADLRLVELAMVMEVPMLGICLGCQLINVALGGTLVQDIASENPNALRHEYDENKTPRMHAVHIEEKTRLASIVGERTIQADSSHHQAIRETGRNLIVSARADDDTIEGIELPGAWVVGVQWHPERLADRREHKALFEALVAAAGGF